MTKLYTTTCAFFCGMAVERGSYTVAVVALLAGLVGWWILDEEKEG